jgi:hypothetical protein
MLSLSGASRNVAAARDAQAESAAALRRRAAACRHMRECLPIFCRAAPIALREAVAEGEGGKVGTDGDGDGAEGEGPEGEDRIRLDAGRGGTDGTEGVPARTRRPRGMPLLVSGERARLLRHIRAMRGAARERGKEFEADSLRITVPGGDGTGAERSVEVDLSAATLSADEIVLPSVAALLVRNVETRPLLTGAGGSGRYAF